MVLMSRSNRDENNGIREFIKNESGWADFFITRIGLILFAAVLLLAAFKVYPMFQEQEAAANLDTIASEIASKIEAVDTTTIPEYKYIYVFNEKSKNIKIEMSTEYVVSRGNFSKDKWGERELVHAEPVVTHLYPPNSKWNNASGLREYLSKEIGNGKNGASLSPLKSIDKEKVDDMFNYIRSEIARTPFIPDSNRPLIVEKVIIYYTNQTEILERDYVLVYQ